MKETVDVPSGSALSKLVFEESTSDSTLSFTAIQLTLPEAPEGFFTTHDREAVVSTIKAALTGSVFIPTSGGLIYYYLYYYYHVHILADLIDHRCNDDYNSTVTLHPNFSSYREPYTDPNTTYRIH